MKLKLFRSETKVTQENTKVSQQTVAASVESKEQESENRESVDGRGEEAAPREGAEGLKRCAITKTTVDEKVGIALRTSIATSSLYVHSIEPETKFEATELKPNMKVIEINGTPCPDTLSEAISLMKNAMNGIVILAAENDETEKQSTMTAMTTDMGEIAVDGHFPALCGLFWPLQNQLCDGEEEIQAIQNICAEGDGEIENKEQPVKEEEGLEKEETNKETKEKKRLILRGLKMPRIGKETVKEEEPEAKEPKELKEKKRLSLRDLKMPRIGKKNKKTEALVEEIPAPEPKSAEEKDEEVEKDALDRCFEKVELLVCQPDNKAIEEPKSEMEESPEAKKMTINFKKESANEAVGLALRNSKQTDGIYVYGIYSQSRLLESEMKEKMRLYTINGRTVSSCNEAINMVKEANEIAFVVGANDEELEAEKEEEKNEASKGWLSLW
jgi:hypothetical protein